MLAYNAKLYIASYCEIIVYREHKDSAMELQTTPPVLKETETSVDGVRLLEPRCKQRCTLFHLRTKRLWAHYHSSQLCREPV